MKKIIFLIPIILFLCGCTASYELTINGDSITEKMTLIETNKEIFDKENDTGWTIRDSFDALTGETIFSKEEYAIKSLNNDDRLGIEYFNDSFQTVEHSPAINQCYRNVTVSHDNDIVTIDTGDEFECYDFYNDLESIKVIFKTNHKVIKTNADMEQNGKYVWNITKDSNKRIIISYDESVTKVSSLTYIIIIIIFLIITVFGYIILKKIKKNNKF